MQNTYIARQPIFDRHLKVIAYELLFRTDQFANEAEIIDGDIATADVLLNAITEIGMGNLVGEHLAFVNLTHNHILQMAEKPFHELKAQLVLEVLEDVKAEDDIISALNELANKGFTVALDDFFYEESLQPLVDISQIIKIDLMALTDSELEDHVKKLSNGQRKLLAEKVETEEEYNRCKELGFDYFQGYYFSRPQVIKGKKLPANKMATMQLLAKLLDPDSSMDELANLISQDVTMSVRVLRYINSAQFSLGKEIESIQRATIMLGRSAIRNIANLIAMSQVKNKPNELMVISMIRAKMAENIAELAHLDKDTCFTVGLFSVIDALMDQKMEDLLSSFPFPDAMKSALLNYDGEAGKILKCVIAYETGDWDNASYGEIETEELQASFLSALKWANESATVLH